MIVQLTVAWSNETNEYLVRTSKDPRSSPDVQSPDRIVMHMVRAVNSAGDLKTMVDDFNDSLSFFGLTRGAISNCDDLDQFLVKHFKVLTPATV